MERAPIVFLKDRFKGPQSTINPKLGQKLNQVARKLGTIARKIKKSDVFGAQFKFLENGSISNYSPHTAWVREDGKQPRVIRHDGLAFVPDPRVYGKCRPAAPKDFVAYKHLPRAKPRVLAKSPKLERAKQINKQDKQEQSKSQTSPKKSQTSPKKPPPKNVQQILSQSRNRRALGHDGLFKRIDDKTRATSANQATSANPEPTGKQNPLNKLKKSRIENADIEFECDTSISLSDTDLARKTPSPKKPAPKKQDTKKTPEDFDQNCRRSVKHRTSALAGKLGNAIPISTIEAQDTNIRNVVCQVEVIPTPTHGAQNQSTVNPNLNQQEVISLSSSIECVEVQLESDTPETIREQSAQKDDANIPATSTTKFESQIQTSSRPKTISTRYILDRPQQPVTPDAAFIKNFDSAMKLLKEISPMKNSMTFQREKESASTSSSNVPQSSTPNQENKSTKDEATKKK